MRGKFITLEGCDASGKSTNVGFVVDQLKARGYDVVRTREPGGTPFGEELRKLVLGTKVDANTEALLFWGIRSNHINELIKPALAEGKIVVCERFADTSYAYQGVARKNVENVLMLEKMVCGDFAPDYTLFFNITEEESERRLLAGRPDSLDHFEKETMQFRKDVYRGFQTRMQIHAKRMHVIDAMQSIESVQQQLVEFIDQVFVPKNPIKN